MISYRPLETGDFERYEKETKTQFVTGDWCSPADLLEDWDKLRAYVLYDGDEWAGFCALTIGVPHVYNPNGAHFLQVVTFEPFRNKGYTRYLYKLLFEDARGLYKTACIHADNLPSTAAAKRYGLERVGTHKQWDLYACAADYFPDNLQSVRLEKRKTAE